MPLLSTGSDRKRFPEKKDSNEKNFMSLSGYEPLSAG